MKPVTEDDLIKVKHFQAKGYSRNQIARLVGRARITVTLLMQASTLKEYRVKVRKYRAERIQKKAEASVLKSITEHPVVTNMREKDRPLLCLCGCGHDDMYHEMGGCAGTCFTFGTDNSFVRIKKEEARAEVYKYATEKHFTWPTTKRMLDDMDEKDTAERVFNWPHTPFKWPNDTIPMNREKLDTPDLKPSSTSLHGKLDLILKYLRVLHRAKNLEPIE